MPGPKTSALRRTAFQLAVTAAVLEAVLRIAPAVIPTNALWYFREDLRSSIAKGRYATRADTVRLERDDGGPELRLWRPFYRKPYSTSDAGAVASVQADEIGFSNLPGVFTDNPRVDVVTIGDSFTWAHAVNPQDTWSSKLSAQTGWKVLNLGKGGSGPYEYLQILKRYGLEKQPRVVVMNIYEGNDLRDAAEYYDYRAGRDKEHSAAVFWHDLPLVSSSYAYNLIGGTAQYLVERHQRNATEAAIDFRYWVAADGGGDSF